MPPRVVAGRGRGRGGARAGAGANPPPPPAASAIVRDLASLNLGHTTSESFNFGSRFPVMTIATTPLTDGNCRVVLYYLIPTISETNTVFSLSTDGNIALFSIRLPGSFVNVAQRLPVELGASVLDAPVYASAYNSQQSSIQHIHPDVLSIVTPAQQDKLPFACSHKFDYRLLLLEGDPNLNNDLSQANEAEQHIAVIRVILTGVESLRMNQPKLSPQIIRSPRTPPPPPPGHFGPSSHGGGGGIGSSKGGGGGGGGGNTMNAGGYSTSAVGGQQHVPTGLYAESIRFNQRANSRNENNRENGESPRKTPH